MQQHNLTHLMTQIIHAVLLKLEQTGILIIGESGSGKSMLALELLRRGHQLVSDDAVLCFEQQNQLYGKNPLNLGQYLHVPQIGIINVCKIYGKHAYCSKQQIDWVLELGLASVNLPEQFKKYKLKSLRLQTNAISDLATLLECAVANQQLQQQGYFAEQLFFEQQQQVITQTKGSTA